MPVISASVLRGGAREFRVEWEAAAGGAQAPAPGAGRLAGPLHPARWPWTARTCRPTRCAPISADTQALQLPGGTDDGSLVTALRELVRAARLAAEGPR